MASKVWLTRQYGLVDSIPDWKSEDPGSILNSDTEFLFDLKQVPETLT